MSRLPVSSAALALVFLIGACGGEKPAQETPAATPSPASTSASGPLTPDPGRKVITVEMTTDDKGVNKFSPLDFEVHTGDVIRFTLVTGVHNVHFPVDSNPPGVSLPAAGPLLQLPGQTTDIKVNWKPGKYMFQCDPHALLGMKGKVEVEDDD